MVKPYQLGPPPHPPHILAQFYGLSNIITNVNNVSGSVKAIPFARYGREQDRQGQCHRFLLPSLKQYPPLLCLTKVVPEVKRS